MTSKNPVQSARFLAGVRILDLTRLLPGGFCTLLLADMGAEVIKVEDRKQGDYFRWMPPFVDRYGAYFHAFNAGKKSVVVDLKTDAGHRVFLRLVGSADVLLESFRPGVMGALGVGSEMLHEIHPHLIFCSLSGYGQTGPYRSRAGHDINYVGLAGLSPTSTGKIGAESVPPFPLPRTHVADFGGGFAAALAIVSALYARQQTGQGTFLDVSLAEATLAFAIPRLAIAACQETEHPASVLPGEELTGAFACYNVYRTADNKYVSLGGLEPKFWKTFLAVIKREELFEQQYDPSKQSELKAILADTFKQRSQAEWMRLLGGGIDTCCEPLLEGSEVLHHPQFEARGAFAFTHIGGKQVLQVCSAIGERPPHRPPAPGYGEHTAAVLTGCGFSPEEIRELDRNGAILLGGQE